MKKNSAVSEERHVLTAYGFFSGRKCGQYADQELLKSLFQNKTPDLRLKYILIQVHAPPGSAVRIKKKAKMKNSVKKRPNGKKKTVQRNRKQRRRESNPLFLQVQATP